MCLARQSEIKFSPAWSPKIPVLENGLFVCEQIPEKLNTFGNLDIYVLVMCQQYLVKIGQ